MNCANARNYRKPLGLVASFSREFVMTWRAGIAILPLIGFMLLAFSRGR